jgi:hypothetical protein
MKFVALVIAGLILLIVLAFGLELVGLEWTKFFAPKKEEIRREVFEQTKSFNEAKVQDLVKYRLQYIRAKEEIEKKAIASTIRHMFADYSVEKLDQELKQFLTKIKLGELP